MAEKKETFEQVTKTSFYDGYWFYDEEKLAISDKKSIKTAFFEEIVYVRFKVKSLQKGKSITVSTYEYDVISSSLIEKDIPTKEITQDVEKELKDEEKKSGVQVFQAKIILKKDYYFKGGKERESEFVFEVKVDCDFKGKTENVREKFPKTDHKYLTVIPKIKFTKIRIQVIDCRSGKVVKNAPVEKIEFCESKQPKLSLFFDYESKKIDVKNETYSCKDSQNALNAFYKSKIDSNLSQSQKSALRLYSCGSSGDVYGELGRTAYKNYITDRGYSVSEKGPLEPLKANEKMPLEYVRKIIIDEYNGMSATDEKGYLYVTVPVEKFINNKDFSLLVKFWDFPVVVEKLNKDNRTRPVCREKDGDAPVNGLTSFNVVWSPPSQLPVITQCLVDDQPGFGWKIRKNREETEFRVSVKLDLGKNKFEDFKDIENYKKNFSCFYDDEMADEKGKDSHGKLKHPWSSSNIPQNTPKNPHFVLFAMQWCQPVWDGIDDPDGIEVINKSSYICNVPNSIYDYETRYCSKRNMHITTNLFQWNALYAKGYGTWNSPRSGSSNGKHNGLDVHARIGDPVFAMRGSITYMSSDDRSGNFVSTTWKYSNSKHRVTYCHLSNYVSSINNKAVIAGQILGYAGRSGNISLCPELPGHVHFTYTRDDQRSAFKDLRNDIVSDGSVDNQYCVPYEDYPLLFPCACQYGILEQPRNPSLCSFSNPNLVVQCWSVLELKCPFMKSRIGNVELRFRMRIQAQLSSLFRSMGSPYLDPGNVTGNWGLLPETEIAACNATKLRKAIFAFKKEQGFLFSTDTFNSVDYNIVENDLSDIWLNNNSVTRIIEPVD